MNNYSGKEVSIEVCDDIIFVKWHVSYVNKEAAESAMKIRSNAVSDRINYSMVADIKAIKGGSKSAMKRLTQKDGQENIKQLAVIYEKRIHLVLYRLLSFWFKPDIPTKFFKCKTKAIKWIQRNQY